MELKEYFSTHWINGRTKTALEEFTYTGMNLLEKVKDGEQILDVGCGTNLFKPFFGDDIYGIDITDIGSDEQISIEEFKTDKKYDVIFALGSINFGDEDNIVNQITCMDKLLKPNGRIYWRCNPGQRDHKNEFVNNVDFFPWSLEYHQKFSEMFNYVILDYALDGIKKNRIYAEWQKI